MIGTPAARSRRPSRAGRFALAALFAALPALTLYPTEAEGVVCDRNCPPAQRDASGCCAAAVRAPPPNTPAKPVEEECKEGREKSTDTGGKCCWAGQVYSNGKCVGVPTRCPAGREKSDQECRLLECPKGQKHVDSLHCCWPSQAWSKSREMCVGIPKCPTGFEPEGEACVSTDKDGDGIPNSKDKCPNEPEDFDGFQDEDGCFDPDNDNDGILDKDDRCPNAKEDFNKYKDEDGCPDAAEFAAITKAAADKKAQEAKDQADAEAAQAEADKAEKKRKRDAETKQREEGERGERQKADLESRRGLAKSFGTVALVGGGLALAGSAYFGFKALTLKKDLSSVCAGSQCPRSAQDDVDKASSAANSGTLFGAVGLGVGAVGIGLYIWAGQMSINDNLALRVGPNGTFMTGKF